MHKPVHTREQSCLATRSVSEGTIIFRLNSTDAGLLWRGEMDIDQEKTSKELENCGSLSGVSEDQILSLRTKRRPLYLKTQFVPRSKHFSSRL